MATKFNPKNERMKKKYFDYLAQAKRLSPKTIESASKAILRYEDYTKFEDIGKFNKVKAMGFKNKLAQSRNKAKGALLNQPFCIHSIR